jgi:hypothetical protein
MTTREYYAIILTCSTQRKTNTNGFFQNPKQTFCITAWLVLGVFNRDTGGRCHSRVLRLPKRSRTTILSASSAIQRWRRILTELGSKNVFEFREDGKAYAVNISNCEPRYTGLVGFWTGEGFEWILYASRESSITVAGARLLPAVQAAWPSWRQRIWTTPFFQTPQ